MKIESLQIQKDAAVDAHEIENLRKTVGWKSHEGRHEKALLHSHSHYSVRDGKELIAFLRVISDKSLHALIVDFTIQPNFQRQGLGKKMMRRVVDDLKKEGITHIQLTFNPRLENFYKDVGFEITAGGLLITE